MYRSYVYFYFFVLFLLQVTPRFTNRYVTATHNALNGSIRELLMEMKEARLRTVAIPSLPPKLSLLQRRESRRHATAAAAAAAAAAAEPDPDAVAALGGDYAVLHTLLRSLRRWIEKMIDDIDAVVFVCSNPTDAAVYRQYFSADFPRDKAEEVGTLAACKHNTNAFSSFISK